MFNSQLYPSTQLISATDFKQMFMLSLDCWNLIILMSSLKPKEDLLLSQEVILLVAANMHFIGQVIIMLILPFLDCQFQVTLCLAYGECKWWEVIFVVSEGMRLNKSVLGIFSLDLFTLLLETTIKLRLLINNLMH